MFLQSYIYWQSLAVQQFPEMLSKLEGERDTEEILWKGTEFLSSDIQQYLSVMHKSTHEFLHLPKIQQFRRALTDLSDVCQMFQQHRMDGMLSLCQSPTVRDAIELMQERNWCEGINSDVLLSPGDYYVSGVNNTGECVKTVTYPHFALAFYTQEERDILASAILNAHNERAGRKQSTLEDAQYKWLSAQRVRISLRDAQPLDIQMLYPAGPYVPWQVWHYWMFLYDSGGYRKSPKKSGLSSMSLV